MRPKSPEAEFALSRVFGRRRGECRERPPEPPNPRTRVRHAVEAIAERRRLKDAIDWLLD